MVLPLLSLKDLKVLTEGAAGILSPLHFSERPTSSSLLLLSELITFLLIPFLLLDPRLLRPSLSVFKSVSEHISACLSFKRTLEKSSVTIRNRQLDEVNKQIHH